MTTQFLPDATDFTDIATTERPDLRFASLAGREWVTCPKCAGHGKWNLTRDAYGAGRHFQAHCGQCNGYGWVEAGTVDATCLHDWHPTTPSQPFRCWHTDLCSRCGATHSYSSDD
jgi:hypothetical protein